MSDKEDLLDLLWHEVLPPASLDRVKAELRDEYREVPERLVGGKRVHVLPSGYVLLRYGSKRIAIYESKWAYDRRMLALDWAEFHKGGWFEGVAPDRPGMYFARSQEGYTCVRTVVRQEDGSLHDASCRSMLKPGQVTDWEGAFWLPCIPRLPDSK